MILKLQTNKRGRQLKMSFSTSTRKMTAKLSSKKNNVFPQKTKMTPLSKNNHKMKTTHSTQNTWKKFNLKKVNMLFLSTFWASWTVGSPPKIVSYLATGAACSSLWCRRIPRKSLCTCTRTSTLLKRCWSIWNRRKCPKTSPKYSILNKVCFNWA